jgi:hypothetical protein
MKIKPAIIALILLGVYALSTFTFAMLQSTRTTNTGQFPTTNIINYTFSPTLQYNLIQGGITIMTYKYTSNCASCDDQRYFLEDMATKYKEVLYAASSTNPAIYTLYLEEVVNETVNSPSLTVTSIYGNKTITNPTENETFSTLCELMTNPPIACVTG